MGRNNGRAREQWHSGGGSEDKGGDNTGEYQVGQWTDGAESKLHPRLDSMLRAVRASIGEQAAYGQQHYAANVQAIPCGGNEARNFADENNKQQHKPQGEAAPCADSSGRGQ